MTFDLEFLVTCFAVGLPVALLSWGFVLLRDRRDRARAAQRPAVTRD